jgi:methionyl-tRNA formyltransferase
MQPHSLRDAGAASTLASFGLDVLIVAAYGLLLPQSILDIPRLGCINVHASLLPRWRGAAPIERAIMAGDTVSGVSIMQMDRGLDTGPVYLTRECSIGARTTGPELELALAELGSEALLDCLQGLPNLKPQPQPADGASYARKLEALDAVIHWDRTAAQIDRQVRALCGRMPAVSFTDSTRLQILEAEPDGQLRTPARPGTIVSASPKTGIAVACGGETALRIIRLRLNRGKGSVLTAGQAVSGFPDVLGEGRELHAKPA